MFFICLFPMDARHPHKHSSATATVFPYRFTLGQTFSKSINGTVFPNWKIEFAKPKHFPFSNINEIFFRFVIAFLSIEQQGGTGKSRVRSLHRARIEQSVQSFSPVFSRHHPYLFTSDYICMLGFFHRKCFRFPSKKPSFMTIRKPMTTG